MVNKKIYGFFNMPKIIPMEKIQEVLQNKHESAREISRITGLSRSSVQKY